MRCTKNDKYLGCVAFVAAAGVTDNDNRVQYFMTLCLPRVLLTFWGGPLILAFLRT